MNNEKLNCSFCGKQKQEVTKLFITGNSTICNECVNACANILEKEAIKNETEHFCKGLPKPQEIVSFLDNYCIGQSNAKKTLAVALYNHYKRIQKPLHCGIEIEKSNILLVGPTGSGKTLLAKSLAKIMNVPFAIADATSLTEAGYVGEDVESILSKLLVSANFDIEIAQKGIVYIDEIDKIARHGGSSKHERDVSGEGVQQGLLKILEGAQVYIPTKGNKKNSNTETLLFDTTHVLFICGGAFVGLKEQEQEKTLGFVNVQTQKTLSKITQSDLIKYGMIPEFIGRLPVIASLDNLSTDDFVRILQEPKNAITKQYIALFAMDGIELEFAKDALEEIAHLAKKTEIGARGLRSIIEEFMLDLEFSCPSAENLEKLVITKEHILNLDNSI